MAYNIGALFADHERLIKVKTKVDYDNFTETFKNQRMEYLAEVLDDIDGASEMSEVALVFAQDVFENFEKRGKVKGTRLISLNYFMIYYVFPTILSSRIEDGNAICDAIRDAWNTTFKDCNINYADFNSIREGFVTKIFGIPISGIGTK